MKIIFGCHNLATLKSYSLAKTLLLKAYDLGIREYDTSPLYSRGYSELLLGKILRGKKDVVISTKIHPKALNLKPFLPLAISLPVNYYLKAMKKSIAKLHLLQCNYKSKVYYQPFTAPLSDVDCLFSLSKSIIRLNGLGIGSVLLHETLHSSGLVSSLKQLEPLYSPLLLNRMINGYAVTNSVLLEQIYADLASTQSQFTMFANTLQIPITYMQSGLRLDLSNNLSSFVRMHPEINFRFFYVIKNLPKSFDLASDDSIKLLTETIAGLSRKFSNVSFIISTLSLDHLELWCNA